MTILWSPGFCILRVQTLQRRGNDKYCTSMCWLGTPLANVFFVRSSETSLREHSLVSNTNILALATIATWERDENDLAIQRGKNPRQNGKQQIPAGQLRGRGRGIGEKALEDTEGQWR